MKKPLFFAAFLASSLPYLALAENVWKQATDGEYYCFTVGKDGRGIKVSRKYCASGTYEVLQAGDGGYYCWAMSTNDMPMYVVREDYCARNK